MEHYREPDRSHAPTILPISNIRFPEIGEMRLNNGVPVHFVPYGGQDIVDIRLISKGGKSFETQSGIAGMTAKMLLEGSRRYSGFEFAQKLDEFGAFLIADSGYEGSIAQMTCLEKHLPSVLPLMEEMLLHPAFPEDEFIKLKERTIHRLQVEEKNTAFIARREFNALLYGKNHPYGDLAGPEKVKAIEVAQLKAFHQKFYAPEYWTVVISGRFDQNNILKLLNETVGKYEVNPNPEKIISRGEITPLLETSGLHKFNMPDAKQATIRLGHSAFKRDHDDFHKMQVVNTILGGFFGSRLMKNIREEKGYTYSIGSAWLGFKYAGIWLVQTDVGTEYIQSTLEEVRKEIHLLIEKGVTESELDLVKNYMLGRSISSRETPSQISEIVTNFLVRDLAFSRLDEKFEIIKSITRKEIQTLAEKYYRPEKMLEIVCGNV